MHDAAPASRADRFLNPRSRLGKARLVAGGTQVPRIIRLTERQSERGEHIRFRAFKGRAATSDIAGAMSLYPAMNR
jgi:hypothetical protein